jgi:hypothetical protein
LKENQRHYMFLERHVVYDLKSENVFVFDGDSIWCFK